MGKGVRPDPIWCPKGHGDTSQRLSPASGITSCPASTPQGFLNMYFLTSLLTPVVVGIGLSQQGPFPLLRGYMYGRWERVPPMHILPQRQIPPQLYGRRHLLCTLLLSTTGFEGWMETKVHFSPWESASNGGPGGPGR